MITLKATSKKSGDGMETQVDAEIRGKRTDLVHEVAHILLEFDNLGNDVLTDAFKLMFEKLLEEKADEN